MYQHNMNILGLKYIYVLFEFKQTEFFTSRGGYLLIIIITILLLITRKFAYVYDQCALQKQADLNKKVLTKDLTVAKFFSCVM